MNDVYLNRFFRKGTKKEHTTINFFFSGGGLGDYINYLPSFQAIEEYFPHIHARIFVNPPFDDVARHVFKMSKRISVYKKANSHKIMKKGELILDPSKYSKFITAPGAHLMDLGAMFFLSLDQVPEPFNYLPEIDYKCPWKWEDRGLKRDDKYIVITPCFTHNSRKMRSRYILELSEYISRLGYKPVLLGKLDFTIDAYKSYIDEGRLLSNNSVNLINMTSLLESIHIMSRAKIVMGIDNGLLHFAGCTNTPIIFGHTITIPRHRTIRRRKGKVIDLTLSQKTLECIGCQSNMRFMLEKTIEGYKGHSFKNCIYNDYACLDLIFKDNCETWKKAIDHILAGY